MNTPSYPLPLTTTTTTRTTSTTLEDGCVWAWGSNDAHQLGSVQSDGVAVPQRVAALKGVKIVAVAAGNVQSLFLDSK